MTTSSYTSVSIPESGPWLSPPTSHSGLDIITVSSTIETLKNELLNTQREVEYLKYQLEVLKNKIEPKERAEILEIL